MKRSPALLLAALSPAAFACSAPPPASFRDHASLVAEASAIVLVQTEAVEGGAGCTLRATKALKGDTVAALPVACRTPGSGDWMTTFDAHTERSFWEDRSGRLGFEGDCSVLAPAFEVGRTYLVFLGIEPDTKQFEQIEGDQDKWLVFVQTQLADGGR